MSSEAITASPGSVQTPTQDSASPPLWPMAHVVLLILLLLLCVFLGSFVAGTSDIWMQLATGKRLVRGEYTFGVDPFSWATAGRYWVNHSWGYAWASYSLYANLGAEALSALNAGLVVLTALLLLRIRPAHSSPLLSLELIGLAILAASARFALQPHMISVAMLAGLLLLLYRAGVFGGSDAPSEQALWSIPVLFAVWANFDVHFMLGLLALVVCWLGLAWTAKEARGLCVRRFGLAVLLSVGACCLNPHHVRVFAPPPDLGAMLSWLGVPAAWTGGGAALREADQHFGASTLQSPLSSRYLGTFQAASLTFFPLWLIHAGSLIALRVRTSNAGERMPMARVCLGMTFAILALVQTRMIPWFAIVCGPLTALNLLDVGRLKQASAGVRRPSFLSRIDLVLAVVIFALANVLAWPGWLHSRLFQQDSPRRVGWGIREDASLRDMALAAADQEPGNIFNLNLEIAPYCAWHAPKSRTFVDARFALFPDGYQILDDIESSLIGQNNAGRGNNAQVVSWQAFFAKHDVRYLALTNYHGAAAFFQRLNTPMLPPREAESLRLMRHLWHDQPSWAQLFHDGRSALFAWSPDKNNESQPLWEKWERQAFGPEAAKVKPNLTLPPLTLADLYFQRSTPSRKHSTEAAMLAHQYLFLRENWIEPYRAANFVASRAMPLIDGSFASGLTSVQLPLLYTYAGRSVDYSSAFDLPALPLLMIRSARTLAPRYPKMHPPQLGPNPNRYLALGYQLQSRNIEDAWTNKLGHRLHFLRNLQIAAAARRAIRDLPDEDEEAHELLALLMSEMQVVDLQLEHRKKIVAYRQDLEKKVAPVIGEEPLFQRYAALTKAKANQVKQLESIYAEHKRILEKRAKEVQLGEPHDSLWRYRLALQIPQEFTDRDGKKYPAVLGLASDGLASLQNAWKKLDADAPPQARFIVFQQLLSLLLQLGMADEAEQFVNSNFKEADQYAKSGNPEFLFLLAGLTAAQGNYEQADLVLADLERLWSRGEGVRGIRGLMITPLATSFMQQTQLPLGGGMAANAIFMAMQLQQAAEPAVVVNFLPEYKVIRGLLALESGDTESALRHFEDALASEWKGFPFPERTIAEKYIRLLKKQRDN